MSERASGEAPLTIACVVLAAGISSRLGRPKQTLPLEGKPLLQHVLDAAARAGLDDVIVVLGHAADEVARELRLPPGARTVVNPDFRSGQSSSLRAGLAAVAPDAGAVVVLLGDQPRLSPRAIEAVTAAYRAGRGPVIQASYGGRGGHPVLLDRGVWTEVLAVEGDVGARDILARHPEWVRAVEVGGRPPTDVDTWEDYERVGGEDDG